ncbi:MAG TPA: hypothetical protein VGM27_01735 [Acidobacteriaceae bacterium]
MNIKTAGLLVSVAVAISLPTTGYAQNLEGQVIASQFGQWRLDGQQPLAAGNNVQVPFGPCLLTAGGRNFAAFSNSAPVTIMDPSNSANDETITPSRVTMTATGCAATLITSNAHPLPYIVTSGTGGAQEALNASSDGSANTVILDQRFYILGGSSDVIQALAGDRNLGLVDVTTVPYTYYSWSVVTDTYVARAGSGLPPQVTLSSGAGASPSALTVTGNSSAFTVSFTTGSTPATSSAIFIAAWPPGALDAAPGCSITSITPNVYFGASVESTYGGGTAAMQLIAGTTALSPATAYSFRAICE